MEIFCLVNKHFKFTEIEAHLSVTKIRNLQQEQKMGLNAKHLPPFPDKFIGTNRAP